MGAYEIQVHDAQELLIVEQALAMYRDLKQVADHAPDGEVLNCVERVALRQGRELTRQSLETVLNAQAEDLEKKLLRTACALAEGTGAIGGIAVEAS
jgi:hypothetical protein